MTVPGWSNGSSSSPVRGLAFLRPRPRVGDFGGAERGRAVLALFEVCIGRDVASTRRMAQLWQVAWAVSMSSEISTPPAVRFFRLLSSLSCWSPFFADSSSLVVFGNGRFAVSPFWLTCLKQPLARCIRVEGILCHRLSDRIRRSGRCRRRRARPSAGGGGGRELVDGVQILRSQAEGAFGRRGVGDGGPAGDAERVGVRARLRESGATSCSDAHAACPGNDGGAQTSARRVGERAAAARRFPRGRGPCARSPATIESRTDAARDRGRTQRDGMARACRHRFAVYLSVRPRRAARDRFRSRRGMQTLGGRSRGSLEGGSVTRSSQAWSHGDQRRGGRGSG